MTCLLTATDEHFAWLLGKAKAPDGLAQPPGGVDDESVIKLLRRVTAMLHSADCRSHWLIVHESEVVGLCGFKRPPDAAGAAEIGYGVAATRRGQGFATRAVALMVSEAQRDSKVLRLLAETAEDNHPSQSVLASNGFVETGRRQDIEDGRLILWAKSLTPSTGHS